MIVKILALVFPILLFLFKYILPSLAETVYKNTKREKEQAKVELLHFPVDLLFVAISYTIPKIIENVSDLSEFSTINETNIGMYKEFIASIIIYCSSTVFLLLIIPFYVFLTKLAEKYYFCDNKKVTWIIEILLYIIAIFLIWISLFI